MSLLLNGTTGLSGVDGSAGTPALQGTDSNTGISFGTDTVTINTGGTARVTTDASGNVGIGTSSPTQILEVAKTGVSYIRARSTDSAFTGVDFGQAGSGEGRIIVRDSQPLSFYTAATERMRLDASGNLGLGVTPSAWYSPWKVLQIKDTSWAADTNSAYYLNNSYLDSGATYRYIATKYATLYTQDASNGQHKWYTAPSGTAGNAITFTQAMTLDASGNLLVGTTTVNTNETNIFNTSITNAWPLTLKSPNRGYITVCTGNDTIPAYFITNTSTVAGFINSVGSTTSYVTTSDYRLKENVAPMTGALAKVAALKPVTYTWKADGKASQGFIAHELQAVVPECVIGEKDEVNEDGSIKPQGIDTSFLVATLTAAIQEQQTLIQSLTSRLEALENK